jgi:hypothetical protein
MNPATSWLDGWDPLACNAAEGRAGVGQAKRGGLSRLMRPDLETVKGKENNEKKLTMWFPHLLDTSLLPC